MKFFKIILCLVFLTGYINIVQGEELSQMEKTSLITLMDDGIVKIETIYRIEPSIETFITSEAIKSSESLRNLTMQINGKELSKEDYQEYTLHDGYKYIGLKRSLIGFADINETNEVYVKYEINISTDYQFKLDLLELCQRTNQQVNVNYALIIQSFDNNYNPVIIGNQDEFLVSHHIEGFVTLSRIYKSFDIVEEKRGLHIKNVFFINAKIRPLQVSTLNIVVDPKNNLVQEIYNYQLRKVEGENPKHLLQYPISEYVEVTANPKINIKNNGNEFVPIRIEYHELKSIAESGNFTEPFYYLGKGLNSNENTLYVGYISNTTKTEVDIEFEYTSNRILTTLNGFHYIFEYYMSIPIHVSKINEFLNFEIPEEYSIDNSNYESNLKMSFEGANKLRFEFQNISDYKSEPLKIKFSRRDSKLFETIKYVNIFLLLGVINLFLLWFFGIIHFDIRYLDYIISIIGIVIVTSISLGIFSGANFSLAVIKYSCFWIPVILEILVFLARGYMRLNKP